jgi:hypothetical protein
MTTRRWWLPAAGYSGGLLLAAVVGHVLSASARAAWFDWASTDLDNLGRNPVGSMIASGFVVESDPVAWLALSLVGLAALGRRIGPVRTAALLTAAHVLGTLVSQGVLDWRLAAGKAPAADRFALDVGPSYLVAAALAAGVLVGRSWWRLGCALGFALLAPHLFGGLSDLEVAAVGHTVAIAVGVVGAVLLARRAEPHGEPDVDKADVARRASPDG